MSKSDLRDQVKLMLSALAVAAVFGSAALWMRMGGATSAQTIFSIFSIGSFCHAGWSLRTQRRQPGFIVKLLLWFIVRTVAYIALLNFAYPIYLVLLLYPIEFKLLLLFFRSVPSAPHRVGGPR